MLKGLNSDFPIIPSFFIYIFYFLFIINKLGSDTVWQKHWNNYFDVNEEFSEIIIFSQKVYRKNEDITVIMRFSIHLVLFVNGKLASAGKDDNNSNDIYIKKCEEFCFISAICIPFMYYLLKTNSVYKAVCINYSGKKARYVHFVLYNQVDVLKSISRYSYYRSLHFHRSNIV